jgi:hypothetical protein
MNPEESEYDQPMSGLGYFRREVDETGTGDSSNDVLNNDIHSTVQRYLQICLQYHKNHATSTAKVPSKDISSSQDLDNPFIQSQNEKHNTVEFLEDKSPFNTLSSKMTDTQVLDEAKQQQLVTAVDRAKAIARRFMESSKSSTNTLDYRPSLAPNIFSLKRKEFLVHFTKKLQEHFLKNLEYLAKKDEQSYLNQLLLLEQHQSNQEKLINYQTQKQNIIRPCVAGIGTKIRQKMESKKRKIHSISTGSQREEKKPRCGLYVVGFPCESDTSSSTVKDIGPNVEEMIHDLFGSFGKIQKVTFYQDKQTGRRKGDGLVLYDIDAVLSSMEQTSTDMDYGENDVDQRISCFLQNICAQVRFSWHGYRGTQFP